MSNDDKSFSRTGLKLIVFPTRGVIHSKIDIVFFTLSSQTLPVGFKIALPATNVKGYAIGFRSWRRRGIAIMYHFVWIPKYRKKVFEESYREVLKKIIEKIGYDYNIEIVELEIPEDHIHMVVRLEQKISHSDSMQIIKSLDSVVSFFNTIQKLRNNKSLRSEST